MTRSLLQVTGWLWVLSGCAQLSPAPPPAPIPVHDAATRTVEESAQSAVALQVVLRGPSGAATRALSHREQLATGSRVALRLTVQGARPLWLYAYHRDAAGALQPLSEQPARIAPGQLHERPDPGLWYRLEGAGGKEQFYVLAAAEPLGARLAEVLENLPDDREPPPLSSTSNRFPGPMYQRAIDGSGVAVMAFTLLHSPPPR